MPKTSTYAFTQIHYGGAFLRLAQLMFIN